jgi:hypothetical protein
MYAVLCPPLLSRPVESASCYAEASAALWPAGTVCPIVVAVSEPEQGRGSSQTTTPSIDVCPICDASRIAAFEATVLGRHRATYALCQNCGLLQAHQPNWLDEAYRSAIADSDSGLLQRNLDISRRTASVIYFLLDPRAAYLDVGGGYGVLTRLMRDLGFDFYWSDPMCENIFARGFELPENLQSLGGLTAIEVMEHLKDPLTFVRDLFERHSTKTLVFTTTLFEGSPPNPETWWYYAFHSGQHVSFYQSRTLKEIALRLDAHIYSHGGYFHVLTDRIIPEPWFHACAGKLSQLLCRWATKRLGSRTYSDHQILKIEAGRSVEP